MLDLMSNIGCSDVVIEAFRVVLYHNLTLTLALVLPLYELLLNVVISKGLHE